MEFLFEIVRSLWGHRGEMLVPALVVGVLALLDAVIRPES